MHSSNGKWFYIFDNNLCSNFDIMVLLAFVYKMDDLLTHASLIKYSM